jgi:hypothetical protein
MRQALPVVMSVAFVSAIAPGTASAASCSIPAACYLAANAKGPGIEGTSAAGYGIIGITTFGPASAGSRTAGVYGLDRNSKENGLNYGVLGVSAHGTGVGGESTVSYGIVGSSAGNAGVYGFSSASDGVYGASFAAQAPAFGTVGGVLGVNASTSQSTDNIGGVVGVNKESGYGVIALLTGAGSGGGGLYASGAGSNNGVEAYALGAGTGVSGSSATGYGASFQGGPVGVYSTGTSEGVYGTSDKGDGVYAASTAGTALYASVTTGYGGYFVKSGSTTTPVVAVVNDGSGAGLDVSANSGVVVHVPSLAAYTAFLASGQDGKPVFSVDGAGDVSYKGTIQSMARTPNGKNITAFVPQTTAPTLEDLGTAQLVAGVATVPFGAEFAAALSPSEPYRVFLTPDGDTKGLYVAAKTARGFVVRETQGGHGSFAFDYRVVGTANGNVGKRSAFVEPASLSAASLPAPPRPYLPQRRAARPRS